MRIPRPVVLCGLPAHLNMVVQDSCCDVTSAPCTASLIVMSLYVGFVPPLQLRVPWLAASLQAMTMRSTHEPLSMTV
eukprot:948390-Amphidinium_carterae.1